MNENLETEVRYLRGRIHQLETKIDWYKAVNQQLREDLENVNRDFRRLYKTSRPSRTETDPLDAIVQSMRNRHAHHTD